MSPASMIDVSVETKVLNALEHSEFVWRTLSGLEKDTQLPRGEILATLEDLPGSVLLISRNDRGERVFSTRSHYRKNASFLGRLVGVLSGEVR